MVTTTEVFVIIFIGIIFLALAFLLGFIFSKHKMKLFLKKIDKDIHKPENVDKIVVSMKEQAKSEIEREVIEDGRRRQLLRGNGNRGYGSRRFTEAQQLGDIKELIRRESEAKRTAEQPISHEGNGKRNPIQNTIPDEVGKTEWDI